MATRALIRNGERFTAETVGTSGTKFKVTHDGSSRALTAGWSRGKQKFVLTGSNKELSYFVDAAMRKMADRILAYNGRKDMVASFFRANSARELRDPAVTASS